MASPLSKIVKLYNLLTNGGNENMLQMNLEKKEGLSLNFSKVAPALVNLAGIMKWDMNSVSKESFDLDIWGLVMQSQGDEDILSEGSDVVYWDQKTHPTGAVSIPFDSRDGSKQETFNATLSKIPANRDTVAVYVFLHKAAERKQTFGMISNATFTLADADTKEGLVEYKISQYVHETALHVGNFRRKADGWHFEPEGVAAAINEQDVINLYYKG